MHSCAYFSADPSPGLKFLLESKADVNATTEDSETMLHILAQNEKCDDLSFPVKILVDAGVPNLQKVILPYTHYHGADPTALINCNSCPETVIVPAARSRLS
ncbi:hypothetical protein BC937DRAFT_90565 [Endogone sp. FLAS-F59071]|nr:hypothetical protein BC937DRAFT_90565 [Endogone sp. FLAS-F59071]|eukprot:RUS22048.1 hypothetical protein BC937DRAFT_90565 [Endogone sp. FLAS-F59071]